MPTTIDAELVRLNNIVQEAFNGSDRAGAVLLGAELDLLLKHILQIHFLPPQKMSSDILAQDGAAGSFSARIELCYRLGFLSPPVHNDLQLIRKIRNRFAHAEQGVTLEDNQLRDWCRNLIHGKDYEQKINHGRKEKGLKEVFFKTNDYLLLTGMTLLATLSLNRMNIRRAHPWFVDWMKKPDERFAIDVPLKQQKQG